MSLNRLSCREYRGRLDERRVHLATVRVDGVSPAVLATWSLAAECAHGLPPSGAAWPALALAAMLDPHGIPGAVLTSPAGCGYVAGRPSSAEAADQALVRAAMTNLARAGLISIDPASAARTVRVHPSVQAAVRAYLPAADYEQAVLAAAEALLQAWPEADGSQDPRERAHLEHAHLEHAHLEQAPLRQALRDCTAALWAADSPAPHPATGQHARPEPGGAYLGAPTQQSVLWTPEAHPVLLRNGLSLEADGLAESAATYWQAMLVTCTRLLGDGHANSVTARDRLAAAYESAGRSSDAITMFSTVLAPSASVIKERSTRTRSPRGAGSPTPTRALGGRPRRSRCTSRWRGTPADISAPGIRSRWPGGPAWRERTRRPRGARTH
jgi:hypothetical protein